PPHGSPSPPSCTSPPPPSRRYIRADDASSSTHACSRSHTRIKLSCEMSITVSASSASPAGGITKERLGSRNTLMTSVTSASLVSVKAHNVLRGGGRRTPRGAVALSVTAL